MSKHIGLFEGIGGFSIAAHAVGWETIALCEWNPFCQTILTELLPNANRHHDIKQTDFRPYRGQCFILTGGFPCQPFSVAGQQRGTDDDRYLWPEMLRAIREIRPRWVVAENVRGLVSWNGGLVFDTVLSDLESEGYSVLPFILPAASVNAPHKRDRVWIVAYRSDAGDQSLQGRENGVYELGVITNAGQFGCFERASEAVCTERKIHEDPYNMGGEGISCATTNAASEGLQRRERRSTEGARLACDSEAATTNAESSRQSGEEHGQAEPGQFAEASLFDYWQNFPTQSPLCSGNDGLFTDALRQRLREDSLGALSEEEIDKIFSESYSELRKESIKAGGNAIVPQVAIELFKAISGYELLYN